MLYKIRLFTEDIPLVAVQQWLKSQKLPQPGYHQATTSAKVALYCILPEVGTTLFQTQE